jgi:hypothetical protein
LLQDVPPRPYLARAVSLEEFRMQREPSDGVPPDDDRNDSPAEVAFEVSEDIVLAYQARWPETWRKVMAETLKQHAKQL